MNLELNCSSGEGERRGGGGLGGSAGFTSSELGHSICMGKHLFVQLDKVQTMTVDSSLC